MANKKTRRERIISKAEEVLLEKPDGVRYSELIRMLQESFPDFPRGTIHGTIWNLEQRIPGMVYKPGRGIFRHIKFRDVAIEEIKVIPEIEKINEEDFYEPFADWLVNELEECTEAKPLGGNKFKDKWGTPDVIGKKESRTFDIIKFQTEIVTAEIKIDTGNLIIAFGQACSYKVFSHKTYIVVPRSCSPDDISKIDSLCQIFGIGLVLFNENDINNPQFDIRVRPIKHEPDMFYVNKYMEIIKDFF